MRNWFPIAAGLVLAVAAILLALTLVAPSPPQTAAPAEETTPAPQPGAPTALAPPAAGEPGAAQAPPQGQAQERAYAVGYSTGVSLRQQGASIELGPQFLAGVRDAYAGREPQIGEEKTRQVLQTFDEELAQKRAQELEVLAERNLEQTQAFLKENAQREDVEVLENGVQVQVLEAGTGQRPDAEDAVRVHVRGTLFDGSPFRDTRDPRVNPDGVPVSLRIRDAIPGLRQGLVRMREGAKWRVFVPPDLAYGAQGQGRLIPPNAGLTYEVELVEIAPPQAQAAPSEDAPTAAPDQGDAAPTPQGQGQE